MEKFEGLLLEAFNSYKIYLDCSGVLDIHQAKLSLLKWPDVAAAAIKLLQDPNDDSVAKMLEYDLISVAVDPVRIIHDSTMARIAEITKKFPIKSEEVAKHVKSIKYDSPLEAKRLLVESTNEMFVTLNTLTGVEYPQIKIKND